MKPVAENSCMHEKKKNTDFLLRHTFIDFNAAFISFGSLCEKKYVEMGIIPNSKILKMVTATIMQLHAREEENYTDFLLF